MQHKAQPTAMGTRPKAKQTKRKLDADPVQAVQAVPVKEEAAEKEDNNQAVQAVPVKEEAAEKEDKNESTQPSSLTILASSHIVQGEQMAKLIEEVNSLRARVATMEATGQVVSPSGSGPQGF